MQEIDISKKETPTEQITVVDTRYETPSLAHGLNVDKVHSILDQAEGGYTLDLFTLYRDLIVSDSHAQAEFTKRKLAVLGDAMEIAPDNPDSEADQTAADEIKQQVKRVKGWLQALSHLLDSTLWPVSLVEKVFRPEGGRFVLSRLVPVPHHLQTFHNGRLQVYDVDPVTGARSSSVHEADPNRYIIHRGHLLSMPDNWGGPMRSIVFWWLLSAMDREWWARFLDRYGSPFLVGRYEQSDDSSRRILERAFRLSQKLGGLVISKETEVELKQAASSDTGASFEKFLGVCQREKSKLILGQTLSAQADATGLGSGTANSHEAVRDDIRQFDAAMLSASLRDQLFTQIILINGGRGETPQITFGSQSTAEIAATSELLKDLAVANLEVADDSLPTISKRLGIQIQRKTSGSAPGVFNAYSATEPGRRRQDETRDTLDAITAKAAPAIARAFSGRYAQVSRIISESKSAAEVESKIRAYMATGSSSETDEVLTLALTSFAAR